MEEIKKKFRNALIIDDDDDDCALIAETLHEIDDQMNCVMKTDGKEALSYVVDTDDLPDIIFLDLHMPKMNGLELLRILKADPGLSRIPVIIWTDSKLAKEMDECIRLGAADFIMKPASFLMIKYEIRNALKAISDNLVYVR